jgi:hypothetical protein
MVYIFLDSYLYTLSNDCYNARELTFTRALSLHDTVSASSAEIILHEHMNALNFNILVKKFCFLEFSSQRVIFNLN